MRTEKISLKWFSAVLKTAFLSFLVFSCSNFCRASGLPPVIILSPFSQSVHVGDSVTFYVTATSLTEMSYKWYCNNKKISGATSSSYTINSVTTANAGNYYVTVINAGGQVNSGTAVLTVLNSPPVAQNDSYTVTQNVARVVSGSLGVIANDSDPDGNSMTAILATNVNHGVLNLNSDGGFTYIPETNFYGTDTFSYFANDSTTNSISPATVTLTVWSAPAITNQPVSVQAARNSSVVLSVGASGTSLHYQWFYQNATQKAWTNATYSITSLQSSQVGNYYVVVTNRMGAVTSLVVNVSIGSAPTVTTMAATSVASYSATLKASINPQGYGTAYTFLYGTNTSYGLNSSTNTLAAGTTAVNVSIPVSGLQPGVTYHYCAVGANSMGLTNGQDLTFTTPWPAPVVITAAASDLTTNSARFNGSVDTKGTTTSYYFLYGTDNTYGSTSATNSLPAGSAAQPAAATITGLLPGTDYHYTIVAESAGGISYGSDAVFTTAFFPPTAATTAATDLGTDSATVNGLANLKGTEGFYYFKYGLTTNYSCFTCTNYLWADTEDIPLSEWLTCLEPSTTYHFAVVVMTSSGTTNGGDLTFRTADLPPDAWTQDVTDVTTNSATLNAVVNPDGTAGSYYFAYGLTTNYDSFTPTNNYPAGTNFIPLFASVTNLAPGTTYHYILKTFNGGGTDEGGDWTFTTTHLPPVATTGGATNITSSSAVLGGTIVSQGADTSYYFVYGSTTNYDSWTDSDELAGTNGVSIVTLSEIGLSPATTYHYALVAENEGGVSVGADMTFTTAYPPPTAQTLAANNVGSTSANLRGRVNPNGAGTGWYFRYGATTNYGSSTVTNSLPAQNSLTTVTLVTSGLSPGVTYHYTLVAVSSNGMTVGTDRTFSTLAIPAVQVAGSIIGQGSQWGKQMQLSISSVSNATFLVYASTNAGLPLTNWNVIGSMVETSPGKYQFTDPTPATNAFYFYHIEPH